MTLRNAYGGLAEDATLEDVVHLLAVIASKLPEKSGANALVTGAVTVTSAPSTAVTGTVTANQGTAGTAAWLTTTSAAALDLHYQSQSAFAESVRSRITAA